LLDILAAALPFSGHRKSKRGVAVSVVFDAARAPRGVPNEVTYQGIRVLYAKQQQEPADTLIEELIRQDSAPKQLLVVSDDHRLVQAGRRRGCHVMHGEEFLRWLKRQRPKPDPAAEPSEKKHGISAAQAERWFEEFQDLEKDPRLRLPFDDQLAESGD
jgi:predicted RNA-binding protein with PIN domain